MAVALNHGEGNSCRLQLEGIRHVGPATQACLETANVSEEVRAALQSPLEYPPLAAATVPGDRVVVALESGLPHRRDLVAGVSLALREAGVDPSQSTFIYCNEPREAGQSFGKWATEQKLEVLLHDPTEANCCALFGVSQAGQALRLNRRLCDADIVLPIGVTSISLSTGDKNSKFGGVFPQFSDNETIARHRVAESAKPGRSLRERREEIDESGWLLGVGLAVQVIPGAGGGIAAVIAGEPTAAAEAAGERYREIWQQTLDATCDLAIVTITGPSNEQSWENVGRALLAAEAVLEPGGAIALCTQLRESPGPSLKRLAGIDDYQRLEHKLLRDSFADSAVALTACRALRRGTVYFCSHLSTETMESLGFAPIASDVELRRLAKSYRRPLVMEDAHRLLPVLKQ